MTNVNQRRQKKRNDCHAHFCYFCRRGNRSLSHGNAEQKKTNSYIDAAAWSGRLTNELSLRFIMQCQYLAVCLNYLTPDAPAEGPLSSETESARRKQSRSSVIQKTEKKKSANVARSRRLSSLQLRNNSNAGREKSGTVASKKKKPRRAQTMGLFSLNSAGLKNPLCCRTYGLNALQHHQQKKNRDLPVPEALRHVPQAKTERLISGAKTFVTSRIQ